MNLEPLKDQKGNIIKKGDLILIPKATCDFMKPRTVVAIGNYIKHTDRSVGMYTLIVDGKKHRHDLDWPVEYYNLNEIILLTEENELLATLEDSISDYKGSNEIFSDEAIDVTIRTAFKDLRRDIMGGIRELFAKRAYNKFIE